MKHFTYKKDEQKEIRFPLGSIGTGCISLTGNGGLVDWEIQNRPAKGNLNGFSHFALRAEKNGKVIDARIAQGDLQPPFTGSPHQGIYWGEGFGPRRETLAGLPGFRSCTFTGTYPFARLKLKDSHFPAQVKMTAFNPFVPLDARASGIPAAFFEFEIRNNTKDKIDYTVVGNLANPLPQNQTHKRSRRKDMTLLHLTSDANDPKSTAYGDLAIGTDAEDTSVQQYWFRGGWFDTLEVYWRDLNTPGHFKNRNYKPDPDRPVGEGDTGRKDHALVAAHITLKPRESRKVRFIVSWNFPNCENYWNCGAESAAKEAGVNPIWKNWYATQWKDAADSAAYALREWNTLEEKTRMFHDALFSSTLVPEVLDAVSANLATLKSPTVLRLEDGTFYGFEGCHAGSGCCPGTCTHVWNYAQALPFLFPELERSIRTVDYRYNQLDNGGMPFRLELPLGIPQKDGRSCADGLFGNVMVTYRDWKISGDDEWLKSLWPNIKKAIGYAWHPDNIDRWDPDKTGVLWGRQHHTLDMELFGPSSWLCGFYLGALKAAAAMARHLGEDDTADAYMAMFENGYKWMDENLFNGEYYQQTIDLGDHGILKPYDAEHYWDDEHKEIKYQIGEGCSIDQTLAQYHADLYGLGRIYNRNKNRKALKALYRNNFHRSMREVYNPCRLYALNDEAGICICSWPEGRRQPAIPVVYAQECMNGFEYAAAVQMIQNGMVKKGLELVRAVRDRYDGERRNPWNEIECGSHYARSMASYALLNALSGFQFDMTRGYIGFDPVIKERPFSCFWSIDGAWGTITFKTKVISLDVLNGKLDLLSLGLPRKLMPAIRKAENGQTNIPFTSEGNELHFKNEIVVKPGNALTIRMQKN